MKFHQKVEAVYCFFIIFSLIGFVWALLEQAIYGEVQHRVVDDIIYIIVVIASIWFYFLGYQHGRDLR